MIIAFALDTEARTDSIDYPSAEGMRAMLRWIEKSRVACLVSHERQAIRKYLGSIGKRIAHLNIGKEYEALLTTLLTEGKSQGRWISSSAGFTCAPSFVPCAVTSRLGADWICTERKTELQHLDTCVCEILGLNEIMSPKVDERRQKWAEDAVQLGTDPDDLVLLAFRQALRYTRTIELYDKYFGKGSNLADIHETLDWIVKAWLSANVMYAPADLELILYTLEAEPVRNPPVETYAISENARKANQFKTNVCERIARQHNVSVTLHVKRTSAPGDIHDRYMKTAQGIYEIGTGFSFRKRNGDFKRTSFRRNNTALNDTQLFQSLTSVSP